MKRAFLAGLLASACIPSHALAQSEDVPDQAEDTTGDIVVTAQRREQSLSDVPISVSALSAERLASERIIDLQAVTQAIPGIGFDALPTAQPRLFIRGIGSTETGAGGDPSSALFIDQAYVGRAGAAAAELFDLERVEVLRGPQGTLWGKNVVGGLVHLVTARPRFKNDAMVQATAGNSGLFEGRAMLNVPLSDTLAVRASGTWRERDGFVRNTFTGNRLFDDDVLSGRLSVLLEPSSDFTALLSVDHYRADLAGTARELAFSPSTAVYPFPANPSRRVVEAETDGFQNTRTTGVTLTLEGDTGAGVLTSITAWRNLDLDTLEDLDGTNPGVLIRAPNGNLRFAETSQQISQEVRYAADIGRVNLVVGGYLFLADIDRTEAIDLVLSPPLASALLGAPIRNVVTVPNSWDQSNKTTSYAVFGEAVIDLAPTTRLTLGGRYTWEDKQFRAQAAGLRQAGLIRSPYNVQADESWDAPTWRVVLDHDVGADALVYASAARGFKSGGFQSQAADARAAATPFAPEFATTYELGLKGDIVGRALSGNLTVFHTDYDDLQVRQFVAAEVGVPSSVVTTNAATARIRGIEAGLRLVTGGFSLDAEYAFLDAEFRNFIDNTTPASPFDLSGNQLTRTPRHSANVAAAYTQPLARGGELTFGANWGWQSAIFDDVTNSAISRREPRHLVDARIGWTLPGDQLSVLVWGRNLLDEVFITHQLETSGANFVVFGAPRTYGVTLQWKM